MKRLWLNRSRQLLHLLFFSCFRPAGSSVSDKREYRVDRTHQHATFVFTCQHQVCRFKSFWLKVKMATEISGLFSSVLRMKYEKLWFFCAVWSFTPSELLINPQQSWYGITLSLLFIRSRFTGDVRVLFSVTLRRIFPVTCIFYLPSRIGAFFEFCHESLLPSLLADNRDGRPRDKRYNISVVTSSMSMFGFSENIPFGRFRFWLLFKRSLFLFATHSRRYGVRISH